MAKGNCECCEAKNVTIYRKGGVDRCYHCHKSEAMPLALPQEDNSTSQGMHPGAQTTVPLTLAEIKSAPLTPDQQIRVDLLANELAQACAQDALSWDDFEPITKPVRPADLTVSIQAGDRLTLNVDLVAALGWIKGDTAEVRRSKDGLMALRRTDAPYVRGSNYKLTAGGKGSCLCLNCNIALRAVEAKTGRYETQLTEWGVIVRLDRPVEAKA